MKVGGGLKLAMTTRVWLPTNCYSSRGGARVDIVTLHNTEGITDLYRLATFWDEIGNASSHVGIDNIHDEIGEYVARQNKAWTTCNANPYTVNVELCNPAGASANWTFDRWMSQQKKQLNNCGLWVGEECRFFDIPIKYITPYEAQNGGRGVTGHFEHGSFGTGHYDVDEGEHRFPWDYVLQIAAGAQPQPEPPPEADDMGVFGTGNITPANPRWMCTFPRSGPDRMTVFADANADNPVVIQHAIHYGGRWAQQNTVTLTNANPWTLMFSADDADGVMITLRDGNQAAISVYALP